MNLQRNQTRLQSNMHLLKKIEKNRVITHGNAFDVDESDLKYFPAIKLITINNLS